MKRLVFKSKIDWWVWATLVFTVGYTVTFMLLSEWIVALSTGVTMIALEAAAFFGVKYVIEGDRLIVYTIFRPTSLPVMKISEIKYCSSILASSALSTRRLAIRFNDRSVLKSAMPIEVSPKDRDSFTAALLEINPSIVIKR